jgi:hypothetical protein
MRPGRSPELRFETGYDTELVGALAVAPIAPPGGGGGAGRCGVRPSWAGFGGAAFDSTGDDCERLG